MRKEIAIVLANARHSASPAEKDIAIGATPFACELVPVFKDPMSIESMCSYHRLGGLPPASPKGEGTLLLQPGKHEFPFSFQLPSELLVTSFSGKYGGIQYCVRAVLERPKLPEQSVRRELQVISHIDVNTPALLAFILHLCSEVEQMTNRVCERYGPLLPTGDAGRGRTDKAYYAEIPPLPPSILDCCIIRVEYSLAVYIHIPGAKKLMLELPLVIGTVPYNGFASRNCSMASQFSVDMSWWALALPEQPEAPPDYRDVVSEEEVSRHGAPYPRPPSWEGEARCPAFACIQDFRLQPPPLYSEVDPHPSRVGEAQPVSFIL
ncbi:PREDICTED: arrestin domain-containing protein 4 [Myotis brandtii]|uniref:arrestin domain-containing protein 4 n=1 Tax=Myotis brandtii TaxID=109478 RepID=UPI000703F1FC|nr:PREDICTED: arrestin domain-containing protein 4 [Myotis brandtii]